MEKDGLGAPDNPNAECFDAGEGGDEDSECVCIYIYICVCVCLCVCIYVCMYVCMYGCMYVHMCGCVDVCMCVSVFHVLFSMFHAHVPPLMRMQMPRGMRPHLSLIHI